jgi:hypothetical protein
MSGSPIDLTASLRGQISVTPEEDPDEKAARLKAEARSAMIEDWKGIATFTVLLLGLCATGCLSAYEGFFDPSSSADTKRWSQTVLSSLVTGGISFVIGRKMGK